jgi:flavin reductase (DIM6/NTAB) family NADH-FMN oxidoreductase RutF
MCGRRGYGGAVAETARGSDGSAAFEAIAGRLTYPMYVVTAAAGDEADGCLVGFTTQCSIDPLRMLVCLSEQNRTYRIAVDASHLGVHLLDRDDKERAALFGGETGDEVDKLAAVAWHPGPGGVPVLDKVPGWYVGAVIERIPLGDHTGFVLDPVTGHASDGDWSYLDFNQVADLDPGHPA